MSDRNITRASLLDSAEACFARFGVAKTTLGDVARHAGVSRASVYRYFEGGRDEIILGVALRDAEVHLGELRALMEKAGSLADAIVEGVSFTEATIRKNDNMALLFAPEVAGHTSTVAGASAVVFEVTRDFLGPFFESARQAGELRDGVTPDDAVEFIIRFLLSFLSIPGPTSRSPQQQKAYVRQYCAGALVAL